MIKTAIATLAATAAIVAPSAVMAGPYVNVETNAGWTGADYTGANTDFHVGYEGALVSPLHTTSKVALLWFPLMVEKVILSLLVKQVWVSA